MDEVEIVDYDPRWPLLFNEEARRLRAILDPSLIVGLEHFRHCDFRPVCQAHHRYPDRGPVIGCRAGHLRRSAPKS